MGWRAAKASGNASMPVDTGGSFAQGFASSFVPLVTSAAQSYAKEKQDERLLELKESLYRQRPRAAGTSAANRADAKSLREITALAEELGVSPTEAAGLYDAADQNASKAIENYNDGLNQGLLVTPMRPDPVNEAVVPSETDDLTSTEPDTLSDNTALSTQLETEVETAEVEVNTPSTDESTEQPAAFESFQVASLGTIEEDLSLLTENGRSHDETTVEIGERIDQELQVADASGAAPTLTYQEVLTSGATPTQTREILAAGTRIPGIYAIPPVTEITTIEEANAALDVLNARSQYIGKAEGQEFADQYEADVRPMLEARVRSLTQLPDLGKMLEENSVDTLREFYENGYTAYEGRVDPEQLNAHRERAGVLLNSSSAYPPIPSDLPSLIELRNRVTSGDLKDAPTEWLETLNKNIFREEGVQRFGNRLTPDYIMSDDRTPRELNALREAAVFYLGGRDPIIKEIDIALGSPVPEAMPDMLEVTSTNYPTYAAQARRLGDVELAEDIDKVGEIYVELAEEGIDITAITASNWPTYKLVAEQAGNTELANKIAELGATYDSRAADANRAAALPDIADVRAENWESLAAAAKTAGEDVLASQIESLGQGYAAAEDDAALGDQIDAVSAILAKAQTNIRDTNAAVDAYLDVANSGYNLVQILREEQDTNRLFGGRLSSSILNLSGEFSAFERLMSAVVGDDPDAGVTYEQGISAVETAERRALDTENLTEQGRAYVMFKAQEARLAFKIARLQQGPQGVISNQDYDAALGQISGSADPEIFADSLRGLIEPGRDNAERLLTTLRSDPQIELAILRQKGMPIDITAGVLRTIDERVEGTPAQQALAWINGSEAAPTGTEDTVAGSSRDNPVAVTTLEEANALTKGQFYITPDGVVREIQ